MAGFVSENPVLQEQQLRRELIRSLVHNGSRRFVERHETELYSLPHYIENCALPDYFGHGKDSPGKRYFRCVPETGFLQRAFRMGDENPFLFYMRFEERLAQRSQGIGIALVPALDPVGQTGDVVIYVKPYGPLAAALEKRISPATFPTAHCVGYFRAAAGIYEHGKNVFHIDTIQTDGYRITDSGHSLPPGLRKIYMDGKKPGVNAWFDEGLGVVEDVCRDMGVPVTISSWGTALDDAFAPDKLRKSETSKRFYTRVPEKRGYETRRMEIRFPAHYFVPSRLRTGDVWVKRF
ncbi:MAG: hypothetical protein HY516_04030 [Candidatus Aenigmarchaeota archaeon]|nr:hypothetical protein [Candidatus Aenigmarchaeota archaeon]